MRVIFTKKSRARWFQGHFDNSTLLSRTQVFSVSMPLPPQPDEEEAHSLPCDSHEREKPFPEAPGQTLPHVALARIEFCPCSNCKRRLGKRARRLLSLCYNEGAPAAKKMEGGGGWLGHRQYLPQRGINTCWTWFITPAVPKISSFPFNI